MELSVNVVKRHRIRSAYEKMLLLLTDERFLDTTNVQFSRNSFLKALGVIGNSTTIPYLIPFIERETVAVFNALRKINTTEALQIIEQYKQNYPEYNDNLFDRDDLFDDDEALYLEYP
jgi:hypothetical protein